MVEIPIDAAINKISFILDQLPLPFLFAGILLAFLIFYALMNKILPLLIVSVVQYILYRTTKSELLLLVGQSETNQRVMDQVFSNTDFIHPFLYMDKALKVATIVPDGLQRTQLTYPIILSFGIMFVYYNYILVGKTGSTRAKQIIPVMSLLLTFGIFGGGFGIWRFLGSFNFLGVPYNWGIVFTIIVYIFLIMKSKKNRR